MEIGERIRETRKRCGLTQKQLAEKLNISYQQIGQYEKGTRRPKSENLQKIADALGVNIDYLCGKTRVDTFTETFLNEHPEIEKTLSLYVSDFFRKHISAQPNDPLCSKSIDFNDLSVNEKTEIYNILFDHIKYSEETRVIDLYPTVPPEYFTPKIDQNILDNYSKLNDLGKEEAAKRIQELTEIKKYTDKSE